MNIKPYSLLFATFCFLLSPSLMLGQDKSAGWPPKKWPHDAKNCHHLLSNSFQCNWKFYVIRDNLGGTIISCDNVNGKADMSTCASVCMLKTGKDTIRIMVPGKAECKPGEKVKVMGTKEPESDVTVPLDREFYIAEEKKGNKPRCRMNQYDERILLTTWGKIAPVTAGK